eukprot:4703822-Amphidinium_carterae.1
MRVGGTEEEEDEAEMEGEEEQEQEWATTGEAIEHSDPTPEPTIISNVQRSADTIRTGRRDPSEAFDRRVRREIRHEQNDESRTEERPRSEGFGGPGREGNGGDTEARMHDRSRPSHASEHEETPRGQEPHRPEDTRLRREAMEEAANRIDAAIEHLSAIPPLLRRICQGSGKGAEQQVIKRLEAKRYSDNTTTCWRKRWT